MKDLSILSVSTGTSTLSWLSEDCPTPKSSSASRTPSALSCCSFATAPAGSAITALSVISRQSRCGGSPLLSRASWTWRSKSASTSCRGETLTDTTSSPAPAFHSAAWRQASRTTHAPMGTIRPLTSASGMKTSGGIGPRVGCSQRSSASTATTRPESRSTSGW